MKVTVNYVVLFSKNDIIEHYKISLFPDLLIL